MTVSTGIPTTWRMPLVWIKVDPSQAGTFTQRLAALLVGQKFAGGTAPSSVPIACSSQANADNFAGQGSMLARMVGAFLKVNPNQELYILPLDEPAAGVAATNTITVTGPATAAGILSLYIAGQLVPVGVAASDTADAIATKIAAAINAVGTLPVTAAAATNVVTLTCRWKGATGNDIQVQLNYGGLLAGEATPAGVSLAITAMTGGAGAPDVTAAIASLGDEPYEYVCVPFTDSTTLGLFETEYGFSDAGRWGWVRQDYGHLFSARRDTYANLMTWGPTGNAGVTAVWAIEPTEPTPVWEHAAAYCGEAAEALSDDPARPLQTLELTGVLPAPKQDRFSIQEINNLNQVGFTVGKVSGNGVPMIMRESTRYQVNVYGQPDNAYELVTTLATLASLFRRMRQRIEQTFPRHKLADDDTKLGPGQAVATPKAIKALLVAGYSQDMYNGLVENIQAFKQYLIVERNSDDPNRVDILWPPDIINQLRVAAILAQFRLQYPISATAAAV